MWKGEKIRQVNNESGKGDLWGRAQALESTDLGSDVSTATISTVSPGSPHFLLCKIGRMVSSLGRKWRFNEPIYIESSPHNGKGGVTAGIISILSRVTGSDLWCDSWGLCVSPDTQLKSSPLPHSSTTILFYPFFSSLSSTNLSLPVTAAGVLGSAGGI